MKLLDKLKLRRLRALQSKMTLEQQVKTAVASAEYGGAPMQKVSWWVALKRRWLRWRYRNQTLTLEDLDAAQGPAGSTRTVEEIRKSLDQKIKEGLADPKMRRHFVNPEHAKMMPWLEGLDPERFTPGYQPEFGTTVYPDSEVIRPYIGSNQEQEDAERGVMPRALPPPQSPHDKMTCCTCFGVGTVGAFQCPACDGVGRVEKKRG